MHKYSPRNGHYIQKYRRQINKQKIEMKESSVHPALGAVLEVSGLETELDKNVVVADEGNVRGGEISEKGEIFRGGVGAMLSDPELSEASAVGDVRPRRLDPAVAVLFGTLHREFP